MIEILAIIGLFWLGYFIGNQEAQTALLQKCQKQHNVYECEIKAVPKVTESKGGN